MSRDLHPLRLWMREQERERDFDWLASLLPSKPTSESIRQIWGGYRRPSWDLAFEIDVATAGAVSAHDLRDERWYRSAA